MKFPKGYRHTATALNAIKNAILEKHRPIAHKFMCGKDQGAHLQYLDSQMALRLVRKFQGVGILCLVEHDSYLVPAEYERELVEEMQKAFCVVMNTGYHIGVS